MTHPCPSSIKPSGARCALPDRSMVVTTASRIIGTLRSPQASGFPLCAQNVASDIFAQGMACFTQAILVFFRYVNRAPPFERLVLCVAFAESVCDLGLGKLRPQIKRMRGVRLDAKLGKQGEGIARNMMTVAVEDMNAILGRGDSKIRVPHLLRDPGDFLGRRRIGREIVEREEPGIIVLGQG